MKKRLVALLVGVMAFSSASSADETATVKYRDYLPEEINALPESVKNSEVPTAYLGATNALNSPLAGEIIALWLNLLFYPGVGDLEAAVKMFQKDLGEEPTGKLTVWQMHQLYYRGSMQQVSEPILWWPFLSDKTDESAMVRGTVKIIDDNIAFPINYQKLSCFKPDGYCELEELSFTLPRESDMSYDVNVIWFDRLFYKITNWTKDAVTAVYEGGPSACRTTTLDLNFSTKEFFMITKNLQKDCDLLGEKMERLKKPRIAQIVDGEEIIRAEYAKLRELKKGFLSKDFVARLGAVDEKGDLEE